MDADGQAGAIHAINKPAFNILGRLIPELRDLVLGLLSTKEIKSIRLTSRDYRDISSHLLIKKAYFALRPKTLAVFNEIIEHPIFRRSVAEIIYDTSLFVEPRYAFSETKFCITSPIPKGNHSKEVLIVAVREYHSLFISQQRIRESLEDVKALRRASQRLVNLSSIIYTHWTILENYSDSSWAPTRLADIREKCCWYLRDGPMSWDVKEACLPRTIQAIRPTRYISQLARTLSGNDVSGPIIRAFTFKVPDAVDGILTDLLQQLPSSSDLHFDRTFMSNLYEIKIGISVRQIQLPLLNRMSDVLAQAKQLRSLTLDFDQDCEASERVEEWFFISRNHWPGLQTLKLSGCWCIYARSLLDFLSRHSGTLRNLLLSDLYLPGRSKETWTDVVLEMQILLPELTNVELYKLSEGAYHRSRHLVNVHNRADGTRLIKEGDCAYHRKHLELLSRWIMEADKLPCTERAKMKQELESLRGPYGWTYRETMETF